MAFKKHNWLKYRRIGMKCEVKVLDEDNRKLDFFRFSVSDKNSERKVGEILRRTYGISFNPVIKPEESINFKKSETKKGQVFK